LPECKCAHGARIV